MEPIKKLFRDAERVKPSPALWQAIAAQSSLASKAPAPSQGSSAPGKGESFGWRLAASLVLAAGVGAFMLLSKGTPPSGSSRAHAPMSAAGSSAQPEASAGQGDEAPADSGELAFFDPDLFAWQADLGDAYASEFDGAEAYLTGNLIGGSEE